jgi:hypothetical protein
MTCFDVEEYAHTATTISSLDDAHRDRACGVLYVVFLFRGEHRFAQLPTYCHHGGRRLLEEFATEQFLFSKINLHPRVRIPWCVSRQGEAGRGEVPPLYLQILKPKSPTTTTTVSVQNEDDTRNMAEVASGKLQEETSQKSSPSSLTYLRRGWMQE